MVAGRPMWLEFGGRGGGWMVIVEKSMELVLVGSGGLHSVGGFN